IGGARAVHQIVARPTAGPVSHRRGSTLVAGRAAVGLYKRLRLVFECQDLTPVFLLIAREDDLASPGVVRSAGGSLSTGADRQQQSEAANEASHCTCPPEECRRCGRNPATDARRNGRTICYF